MKSLVLGFVLFNLSLVAADFSGKWTGSYDVLMSDGQAMKGKMVLTLAQNGTDITGTAGSDEGQMTIQNGKVTGDKVTFEIQTEGPKMVFDLHLEDEHLRGDGKGDADGNSVKVKLDLTKS